MKVAEKCPKCNGFVQTKSIKKPVGSELVDVPIAQFCLNPACNWYQDFVKPKHHDDMMEDFKVQIPEIDKEILEFDKKDVKKPMITMNLIGTLAVIIGCIVVYAIFFYFVPDPNTNNIAQKTQSQGSGLLNNSTTSSNLSNELLNNQDGSGAPIPAPGLSEPRSYSVRMDVSHGFSPDNLTINRNDTIIWSNEENQRIRIALISKDGLFEYKTMQYIDKFRYQFTREGTYTFVLAEHPTLFEFENAVGIVIVR